MADYLNTLFFGIYPYIALAVLAIGCIVRYDREPYTWRSGSSQLLRRRQLVWGSNLFHIGVLIVFLGHLAGLLTPIEVFDAMGITLVAGRGITARDRQGSENVVVVSEAAARRFWPDESPLGNVIYTVENDATYRVIGIARDVKIRSPGAPAEPVFYFAEAQSELRNLWLIARGQNSAPEIAAALRRVALEVKKDLVIMSETTLEEQLAVKLFPVRAAAGMLAVFGLMALVLAAIGLYGVVSFSVSRRTREVGIRMSLGADGRTLTWVMVRGAIGVVVIGALIGVGTAFGMAQLLRHFLIGVAPGDPVTFISVPLLLCSIAILAALVPTRRACRVSPVTALRCE